MATFVSMRAPFTRVLIGMFGVVAASSFEQERKQNTASQIAAHSSLSSAAGARIPPGGEGIIHAPGDHSGGTPPEAVYQTVLPHRVAQRAGATVLNYEGTLALSGHKVILQLCEDVTTSAVRQMQQDGACDTELNPTRSGIGMLWESTCKAPEICEEATAAGLTFTSAEADWYCPRWAHLFDAKAKADPALCDYFDSRAFCKSALEIRLAEPMTEPIGEMGCAAARDKRAAEIKQHADAPQKHGWMDVCKAITTNFLQTTILQTTMAEQSGDFSSLAGAFDKQCRSVEVCEFASAHGWGFTAPQANGVCPRWSDLLKQQLAENPDRCETYASDPTDYCEAAWLVRAEFMPYMLLNGNFTCDSVRVMEIRGKEKDSKWALAKTAFWSSAVGVIVVVAAMWARQRAGVDNIPDFYDEA